MAAHSELVLVTGATSFIGSHVINLLLQEGWKVRGTVRNPASDKTKALQEVMEAYAANLELVRADLNDGKCWDAVCSGCTYVLHLACPVEIEKFAKDPMNRWLREPAEIQKIIDTVVTGTLSVLNAAKSAGAKRVVMTSSVAAMIPAGFMEPFFPYRPVPGAYDPAAFKKIIKEEVWSDEKLVDGYLRAKTVSEREAWKAMEGSKTEFVCINPCYVLGPQLHKLLMSDSSAPVDIGMRQPPNNPKALPATIDIVMAFCDVRDVAKAHVRAMLKPEAAGQRYLIADRSMSAVELNDFLLEVYKPMGYRPLSIKLPKCVAACLGCCDPLMDRVAKNWGQTCQFDSSKMRRDLLPELADLKQSIIDTVASAVVVGRYERKPGFKSDKPEYQGTSGCIKLTAKLD